MTRHNKPENPYLAYIIVFSVLAFIFLIMIFVPVFMQLDMMKYGYAISFVSFFLTISFIITVIILTGFFKRINKMFEEENILACWQYDKEAWTEFTEKEFITDKKEKRFLFLTILIFVLVVTVIFIVINREAWKGFLIIFSVLLIITGLLSFLLPELKKRKNLRMPPRVFISLNGVYVSGEFHIWNYLTAKLEKVHIDEKNMLLRIGYSYIASYHKGYKEVRIPIPENKLDEAVNASKLLEEKRKTKNRK